MDIPVELTEEFVADHTDGCLGTVVLKAAQVRVLLQHRQATDQLLLQIRPVLRTLALSGDKNADHLVDKINALLGEI